MRIIAGKWKGQRLSAFSDTSIRPMTDRVKTCVFDTLSAYRSLTSQTVLDLFSGTGGLAFEALSRGAKEAYLVDSGRSFLALVKKNMQALQITREITKQITLYRQDVFRFLLSYAKKDVAHTRTRGFDVIFADPPFKKKWGFKILKHLTLSGVLNKHSVFVLEISSQEDTPLAPESCYLFTMKKFGDKKVLFYEWEG